MTKLLMSLMVLSLCLVSCAPISGGTQGTSVPQAAPTQTNLTEAAPVIAQPTAESPIARPFPQHTHYAAGSILPNHRTQAQLDDDVRAFYDHWKLNYVMDAGQDENGHPLYRIAFGKDLPNKESTVSEGQGFGMTILPVMAGYDPNAQVIFDGLWRFARAHPSEVDARLMDWKVPDPEGNDSAFDGDADMALGLLLADAQWGSLGEVNYLAEAKILIAGILESTIGPDSRMPMLGDWTDANGADFSQYTPRSSDFMLVNFRAYGKASGNAVWSEIIVKSQEIMSSIQQNFSPATGLLPDFIVMKGESRTPEPSPADFLEGPNDGNYYYNAGRDPWRVGADALLNGDEASRVIVQKLSLWAESVTGGDPMNFRSGYYLAGNPLEGSDYFTTFFVAPLGVAAMTNPAQQDWLNKVYDAVVGTHEDYYEDTVTLLCLLVMSGNAWVP